MARDNEELLQRLGPLLEEFREHGLDPTLFGGLAVHLQAAAAAGEEEPEQVWNDPRFLTRMVRPTRDIDLALFEESTELVHTVLADLGFRADGAVYKRDRDSADAVQAMASGDELEALLALLAEELETLGTRTDLRVMGSAGLVVLKAVAWCTRYEPRDLVDLARLAIADLLLGGATRTRLEVLVLGLDEGSRHCLERIRQKFATPEHPGPRAFCNAVRSSITGRLVEEWPDGEEIVATVAAAAVKKLLRGE